MKKITIITLLIVAFNSSFAIKKDSTSYKPKFGVAIGVSRYLLFNYMNNEKKICYVHYYSNKQLNSFYYINKQLPILEFCYRNNKLFHNIGIAYLKTNQNQNYNDFEQNNPRLTDINIFYQIDYVLIEFLKSKLKFNTGINISYYYKYLTNNYSGGGIAEGGKMTISVENKSNLFLLLFPIKIINDYKRFFMELNLNLSLFAYENHNYKSISDFEDWGHGNIYPYPIIIKINYDKNSNILLINKILENKIFFNNISFKFGFKF